MKVKHSDITKTAEWDSVLVAIYDKLLQKGVKKTGKRKVEIFLGEVDDATSETKVDVLKKMKADGVLTGSIRTYSKKYFGYDVFLARAVCEVVFSLKKYKKYLSAFSIIPKYYINYDDEKGLLLNDSIIIKDPHEEGNVFHFWMYVLAHPNQKILQETLDEYVKKEVGEKKFRLVARKIVQDYGFTGDLKKLFFPVVSTTATIFNNPITQKQIDTLGISSKKLEMQMKKFSTRSKKT